MASICFFGLQDLADVEMIGRGEEGFSSGMSRRKQKYRRLICGSSTKQYGFRCWDPVARTQSHYQMPKHSRLSKSRSSHRLQ
eukprot:4461710-Amphidinium_carterae.1